MIDSDETDSEIPLGQRLAELARLARSLQPAVPEYLARYVFLQYKPVGGIIASGRGSVSAVTRARESLRARIAHHTSHAIASDYELACLRVWILWWRSVA